MNTAAMSARAMEELLCERLETFPARVQELAAKCPHDYEQACLSLAHHQQCLTHAGRMNPALDSLDDAWGRLVSFRLNFYLRRLKQALHELDQNSLRPMATYPRMLTPVPSPSGESPMRFRHDS